MFYNSAELWDEQDNQTVGTSVLSITIVNKTVSSARQNLTRPFTYTLSHDQLSARGDSYCVFWDGVNTDRLVSVVCMQ